MKVLSVILWDGVLSFFVAALLIFIYQIFNIPIAYPFVWYWIFAFIGCLIYDCIKYSLKNEDNKDEEKE